MRRGLCALRATPDIRGRIPLNYADGPSPRRESVGRSGTSAPYSAALRVVARNAPRIAADCDRQPARRPPARRPPPEPEQIQPPQRCQQAPEPWEPQAHRSARQRAPARSPRVRRWRTRRQLPRLGEDPGGTPSVGRRMPPWHRRSRWGPRSTGASAPARFPGAARPGRHEPAEPILGTLGAGQRRAGSGGTATRGAAGHRRIYHDGRGPRRGKAQGGATAGHAGRTWVVKRAMPAYRSAKPRVFNALRRSHGGPCVHGLSLSRRGASRPDSFFLISRTIRARWSRRRSPTWSRTRSKRPTPGRTCSSGGGGSWTIGPPTWTGSAGRSCSYAGSARIASRCAPLTEPSTEGAAARR